MMTGSATIAEALAPSNHVAVRLADKNPEFNTRLIICQDCLLIKKLPTGPPAGQPGGRQVKPCPNRCDATPGTDIKPQPSRCPLSSVNRGSQVVCNICHMTGPLGGSEHQAVRLWDELPRAAQIDFLSQALNESDGVCRS
ncbi:MAG: hypothetical protein U5P41_07325 [Gammaproteobacteria bacterium]|nr:hypothetical protein [Gammaproteobacteria bacterium]